MVEENLWSGNSWGTYWNTGLLPEPLDGIFSFMSQSASFSTDTCISPCSLPARHWVRGPVWLFYVSNFYVLFVWIFNRTERLKVQRKSIPRYLPCSRSFVSAFLCSAFLFRHSSSLVLLFSLSLHGNVWPPNSSTCMLVVDITVPPGGWVCLVTWHWVGCIGGWDSDLC